MVEKIAKRFDAEFPLNNLIGSLSLKEKERKLILTYGITNKSASFFIILLFILKQKINIIFEFDKFENISFNFIKIFCDINKQIEANKNKILHLKNIKNELTFSFDNINNIKFEELKEFELPCIKINGDKNIIEIINMKDYLNKKIINNNMDNDLEERFNNIQKQFVEQKNIIDSLKHENDSLNKEVSSLKEEINKLDTKLGKCRGRFIFKSFIDYIYVLFNINIDLKNKIKMQQLVDKAVKENYDISYILCIIKYIQKLYFNETENSHNIPRKEEIKEIILSQLDENSDKIIFDMFDKLHPENVIQKIIEKNNDLTKLLISNSSEKERVEKKSLIISEINGMMSLEEKEKSVNIIKQIIDECKNINKYDDEYYFNKLY